VGRIDFANRAAVSDAVFLPSAHANDLVAGVEAGVFRRHHLAGGAADHHLIERLRRGVALRVAHAAAHVRIERQPIVTDQHLSISEIGDRRFNELEVVVRRLAGGT
jgi:hypothetical protein